MKEPPPALIQDGWFNGEATPTLSGCLSVSVLFPVPFLSLSRSLFGPFPPSRLPGPNTHVHRTLDTTHRTPNTLIEPQVRS